MVSAGLAAPLTWSDQFLLGHAALDDTHREFVERLAAMQRSVIACAVDDSADTQAGLDAALAAFIAHAEAHFGEEERWMTSSAFPARDCHVEEHDKVMASLREVAGLRTAGAQAGLVGQLAQALVEWFPGHADHMDSALAHWLSQLAHGGKPVVLRKGAANPGAPGTSRPTDNTGQMR